MTASAESGSGAAIDTAGATVLEMMGTAQATRWYTDQPIPDELLERLLWAGTRASNPGNSQPWHFLVIRSREVLAAIGELLLAAGIPTVPDTTDASLQRTATGAANLIEHWADLPAVIVICAANVYPPARPQQFMALSSIYAAAQNMVVAARALGLGAAFTTFQHRCEPAVRELLGIPPEQIIGVMMPVGYSARPPRAVRRKPLDEVVHYDHW